MIEPKGIRERVLRFEKIIKIQGTVSLLETHLEFHQNYAMK